MPVGRALQDDVVELARLDEPADGADADLVGLPRPRGRRADLSGRHLHVLLAQRADDFAGRDAAARQPVRIQPQPHRVLALAEDLDAADAGHALQIVAHEAVEVVADEERIVLIVLGVHARRRGRSSVPTSSPRRRPGSLRSAAGPTPATTRFWTSTAATSMSRSTSKVTVTDDDPVLPLDDVMYCMPSTPLRACSIGVRHRRFDDFGARALIERVDGHRRRRQLRKLRDRQRRNRHGAGQDDDQRADARQNRAADECVYDHEAHQDQSSGSELKGSRRSGASRRRWSRRFRRGRDRRALHAASARRRRRPARPA